MQGTVPRAFKSAANIAIQVCPNKSIHAPIHAGVSPPLPLPLCVCCVQFFLYDFLKRALHVSADDLKLFFDVMSGLEVNPGATPPNVPF